MLQRQQRFNLGAERKRPRHARSVVTPWTIGSFCFSWCCAVDAVSLFVVIVVVGVGLVTLVVPLYLLVPSLTLLLVGR